ncbi:MAG TPA: branched-chain amino acid aminotransferase [Victivallales bacterium]|nr:branched-chain amino acid aminotransferase [Victivallales bacterium]
MADIDWSKLSFSYMPTKCHLEYKYSNGKWGKGEIKTDPNLTLSIAATCLHYGQESFEGLKAYCTKDGSVKVFRDVENAKRMAKSADYLCMPEISEEMYAEAVTTVVKENIEYVPPYGTGGSLYIRPLLIGTGAVIGVAPSTEYIFLVLVTPVGPYYPQGIKPVDAIILDEYDRAAPSGSGCYKVGGNYAAGFSPYKIAKSKGFPVVLFLDSKEHKYIDEFTTSNFIAITKDGKYVTPSSKTILPSITNMSLLQLAEAEGLTAERRPIALDEIDTFAEIGACGTAVVITPIANIVRGDKTYKVGGTECGPVLKKLYDRLTDIQYGRYKDQFNWMRTIE